MERGVKEPPATCPPRPYLENLEASRKDAAAPAVCAARWKKVLAAGWTTDTSVTTKPSQAVAHAAGKGGIGDG
jgi:hypothetical protein